MDNILDINALLKSPPPVLLSAVIWSILQAIKQLPGFPSSWLPFLSILLGGVGYPIFVGWNGQGILQGLLIGGLPTAVDQLFRQRAKAKLEQKDQAEVPPSALLAFFIVAIGLVIVTQGCASEPLAPPKAIVAASSRATAAQAAEAVYTSAQLWTRSAIQVDNSQAEKLKAAASRVGEMATGSSVDAKSLKEALGEAGGTLNDVMQLYEGWSPGRSKEESAKVLASLSAGIKAGLAGSP